MKRKVYLTLEEQDEHTDCYLDWPRLSECDVITIDERTKSKLEEVNHGIRRVRDKANSSGSYKEDLAESLIRNVTFALTVARKEKPNCSAVEAMPILRAQGGFLGIGASDLERFLEVCVESVLNGDSELFHALADLLKEPTSNRGLDMLISHAHRAYYDLQQEGTPLPTKRQVAERAIYHCAKATILAHPFYQKSHYNWKERDDSEFPYVLTEAIQQESEKLRNRMEQKESRFWTNSGLKALPRADKLPKRKRTKS